MAGMKIYAASTVIGRDLFGVAAKIIKRYLAKWLTHRWKNQK
jgi:hypothetical protein